MRVQHRDLSIDTLRGIACVLLVAFHVVGHNSQAGIHVSGDSFYRYFAESAVYLRMPMFAFLSGVVYAWRPLGNVRGYAKFMGKKAKRLLVSYAVFVPLIGIAQLIVPAANSATNIPPYLWYIYPLSPYWFLISTFWVFAIVSIADALNMLDRRRVLLPVIFLLFAVDVVTPTPDLTYDTLGSRSALFLLPFFLSGVAATRFRWRDSTTAVRCVVALVAVVAVTVTQLSIFGLIDSIPGRHHPVGILAGLSLCMLMLASNWKVAWLAWIGGFSSGIFLFHPFAVSGTRAVLNLMGVYDPNILFPCGLVFGVVLSIAAVAVLRKFSIGRLVLGEKWRVG